MFSIKPSVIVGLLLILVGLTLLFNNLGITDVSVGGILSTYWPLIFVYLGLSSLTDGFKEKGARYRVLPSERIIGLIFLVVGLLLILRNLQLIQVDLSLFWSIFWPLIIIFMGLNLLKGVFSPGGTNWAFMSGIEKNKEAWKLEDKNYFAIMGGIDLDLTLAEIPEGDTVLVLTAIMGGIDVLVPPQIPIECEGMAIMGGVDFFQDGGGGILMNRRFIHKGEEGCNKKLFIRCHTIMGGIGITGRKDTR